MPNPENRVVMPIDGWTRSETDDPRMLHLCFCNEGAVLVTGFLQFTRPELEELSLAIIAAMNKLPPNYTPLYHMKKEGSTHA